MSRGDDKRRLEKVLISPLVSISEAIPILDRAGMGVLLLCEGDCKLVGVITDGDIRRAILRKFSFQKPCSVIANKKPVVARPHVSPSEALHLMNHSRNFVVNHLPLVDKEGRVVGLLLRRDLVSEDQLAVSAVIMAGGQGTRLRPIAAGIPKSMLSVGGRPLMEVILEQLRQSGIRRVNLATHYKGEMISEHFGDGKDFGMEIRYVEEDQPLGTAGALSLMGESHEPILVINGDILTRVDFRAMLEFHRNHQADMTVAVKQYEFLVPYGVVESDGVAVNGISEKPVVQHLINAGIYLLIPEVCRLIPKGQRYDMPDLIRRLVVEKRRVVSFPVHEYWLDIGRVEDYRRALSDLKKGEV
jgi:dTDP-glucose pyrophosphorylase/CBS domain-containing protein